MPQGADNPGLLVGTILDDRYELREWVAPGRLGSNVYRATHLVTEATVGVRLWTAERSSVRDGLVAAFRREGRAMGVYHPSLIAILDLGFTDSCVYIVTEFIESRSLRELLDASGPLGRRVASRLVLGGAEALATLHQCGIVSGGLTPQSIRVTGTTDKPGRMLVTPFGLTSLQQVGTLLGEKGPEPDLEGYLSPEQRGGEDPDARSDVFSLAVIFLEMLGGRLTDAPHPPGGDGSWAGFGKGWRIFFESSLARDPDERYQTAEEFASALRML